ncbi:MAG: hypothetical protein Q9191_006875 [Dirinaria sp. TL-2023a]
MEGENKGCYLVISPNPEHGNYIYVKEKVKTKDGTFPIGDDPKEVHYVKFGDEKDLLSQVRSYNSRNPSIWFRCIEANQTKLQHAGNFGKYLQDRFLKPRLPYMAEVSDEWHLCFGNTKFLQDLTAARRRSFVMRRQRMEKWGKKKGDS